MGKILIWIGVVLVVTGILIQVVDRLNLGKLPGGLHIQKGNFTMSFPWVTCLIISIVLSVILYIINRLKS